MRATYQSKQVRGLTFLVAAGHVRMSHIFRLRGDLPNCTTKTLPLKGASMSKSPTEVFDHFKTLVGEWVGTTNDGRELGVKYTLSANDTVLVETWALRPNLDALTLYHMNGDDLMATHYCPLGNQPRLRLNSSENGVYYFEFVSATNLESMDEEHNHSFEFQMLGPDQFLRSESYVKAGEAEIQSGSYTRVASSS